MTLDMRSLGKNGPVVSALGLGCMGMSEFYGHSDRAEALNTIAAALDAGVSLFDTGDFYGMGDNEILLGEALRGQREKVFIQVKSGAQRGPDGAFIGLDTRPSVLKNALSYSLKRLKTDHIDLYQVSKDPAVPIEDAVGAISDLVQQGYVRYVGLTNVDAETVRRGHATHPLTALQLEYSLMYRDIEHTVLPLCRELGIGVTAYGVLSRGLLTGSDVEGDGDVRQKFYSRFQGENLAHNRRLAEALGRVASSAGISTAQAAIGWVASQGQDIIPLVGARTVERLGAALRSPRLLSAATLAAIQNAIPEDAVRGK